MINVGGNHVVRDEIEPAKPEGGDLIQDGALLRDRVRQNDVEGRKAIGGNEEERVAEIEDFTDFSGAEFWNAGKVEVAQRAHLEIRKAGKQEKPKKILLSCFPDS